MSDTILTLNPTGTRGVALNREHYNRLREFIVSSFHADNEISFNELMDRAMNDALNFPTENELWYLLKVKQDLQARKILKITFRGASPRQQILRLNKKALKRPAIPY